MLLRGAGRVLDSGDWSGAARLRHACPVRGPAPALGSDSDCFASARRNSSYAAAASGGPDSADDWVHHSFDFYLMFTGAAELRYMKPSGADLKSTEVFLNEAPAEFFVKSSLSSALFARASRTGTGGNLKTQ